VWNNSMLAVFEYSGLATSSALDVAAAATGNSNSLNTGPITTSGPNELLFASGYGNSGGTLSAGSNYVMQLYTTHVGLHLGLEDRTVSAAGTYNATFTDTGAWDWVAQIAAFRGAGSPPPPGLCGQVDDGLTHAAPSYNTLTPGAVSTSYTDPQYGCPVTRISDGKTYCNSQSTHQYSALSPINADNSLIMMQLAWQCGGEGNYIKDSAGALVVSQFDFPRANTANIPWDQFDPNIFYYSEGITFYKGSVNRSAGTVTQTPLCSFPEYTQVDIPDQEDISYDNNHIWLVGNPSSPAGQAFLVTLNPSHTGCTKGATVLVGAKESGTGWHKIQNTASNKLAVDSNVTNTTELYNPNGTLFRRMADTIHMDFGFDSDGVTEVAVGMFYQGTAQNGCPSNYGAGVQNLATGVVIRCLLPDIGHENAHHISFRDSAPRGPGWVLLSLERSTVCHPVNRTGLDLACINGNSDWFPYSGEEVIAKVDGTQVRRLAHHRSRSGFSYWAEPRGAISKDGKVVIFDSNFNDFNGGSSTESGWEYADTYMIRVQP